MPGVQLLPAARPHPFAGQNVAAFKKILQTLGETETLRRKKMLNTDILGILQGGGGLQDIAEVVQAHQQPTYSPGLKGLLQRIAAPFAERPGAEITGALTVQAFKPRPRTEIQKLTAEGYTPEEAKMIRDISHGIKPRASVRQTYDTMTEVEKMDFLTKVKQRAEGQYYGIEGGNVQPRDPKLLDWTLRELNKLPQYRQQEAGFDPEGTGYDSDTAREAGLEPDETGHWGSLDPRTGMLLKGMKHETIQKTIGVERELGNKIVKRGDRYYSIPPTRTEPPADYLPPPEEWVADEAENEVRRIYLSLPREIQDAVFKRRAEGMSWKEILETKELQQYRENK